MWSKREKKLNRDEWCCYTIYTAFSSNSLVHCMEQTVCPVWIMGTYVSILAFSAYFKLRLPKLQDISI